MEWLPSARVEVVNEALPLLKGMLAEIGAPASRNCTEPLPAGVTVAVKTRVSPSTEGLAPEAKLTVRLEGEVRRSTGLFREFWKFMGQSICAGLNAACVSRIVTRPGLSPEAA